MNEKPVDTHNADRLEEVVSDFVAHFKDDLPDGPPSELGSDEPKGLNHRTDAEFFRLAALGKKIVDDRAV